MANNHRGRAPEVGQAMVRQAAGLSTDTTISHEQAVAPIVQQSSPLEKRWWYYDEEGNSHVDSGKAVQKFIWLHGAHINVMSEDRSTGWISSETAGFSLVQVDDTPAGVAADKQDTLDIIPTSEEAMALETLPDGDLMELAAKHGVWKSGEEWNRTKAVMSLANLKVVP